MVMIATLAALLLALAGLNVVLGGSSADFDAEIGLSADKNTGAPRFRLNWRTFGCELLPLALFSLGLPMAFQSPGAGGLILAAALLHFGCRRTAGRPLGGGAA